ncbi:uncharacterized protein Z520_07757 [Fonsecaea multimorphosa CBS 102226]|uniref:Alpha/beta hydrolase fold-3 domain-containing protein n=1 Tax=Fonsecaea multimorphosa CBS 102226 TaxID=1442371 RepID=A0A0D2IHI8_9EURO|nr:uncharacterized protein Z520_07757 [Fonsecaea multimorphosa CBS 102226]KIX96491.1 hypothetical protein Z520_07757 [Fonsecaea multimorphosa CBS 102226]OAL28308.1 hypothetical protein AYO22_03014 [Fonsecaea multimorphosa]
MPTVNWHEVRKYPCASIKIVAVSFIRVVYVVASRILNPFSSRVLSLRNAIAREILGTAFVYSPTIFYSAPRKTSIPKVDGPGWSAYLVPNVSSGDIAQQDAVVLFAHGGGMIAGHPLQYRDEYKRWSQRAAKDGQKVLFFAVKYPLSTESRWPTQRDAVIGAYEWLLSQKVPATKIIFAGDSAGGNLILLTLLYLRDQQRKTPLPVSVVLMSPWVDMSAAQTLNSPLKQFDFMLEYDAGAPIMNSMLRPENTSPSTADISAILHQDLTRLPPQLVMYSATEVLSSDSERWITRSRAAGNDVEVFAPKGELHTFSCGWPMTGRKMQDRCDELFLSYILNSIRSR